jgi:DNA-binding transcriptional ArsR family regulator
MVANKSKSVRRDVFQAIADPTRRAIIFLLAVGTMTPNAMAEHFNTSRQAVSKHLKVLVECEVVNQEQQGREIHYHLNNDKMKEIDNWLQQFKQLMERRFNQLDSVLDKLKTDSK